MQVLVGSILSGVLSVTAVPGVANLGCIAPVYDSRVFAELKVATAPAARTAESVCTA